MKILIVGDSFSSDWTRKYDGKGWPNLLDGHHVVNLAEAGVSEYKILKQLQSINFAHFDLVCISHASPYRVFVDKHPIHSEDVLHNNADMIYSDILFHKTKLKNMFNKKLSAGITCFEGMYTDEYFNDIHQLIRKEIRNLIKSTVHIELGFFKANIDNDTVVDLYNYSREHKGLINHLSDTGNKYVANIILNKLKDKP